MGNANILSAGQGLYGNSGNLNRNYTSRAKEALENIADLSDELRTVFPLHQGGNMSGVSRVAAHLHLLYHRVSEDIPRGFDGCSGRWSVNAISKLTNDAKCIILVTRPLLLALLKRRFSSFDTYITTLNRMRTARNLTQMCIDSSQKTVTILEWLLSQGLISTSAPP